MSKGDRYYPGGIDCSDRTPDGSDRTPATQYTGAYTQYTRGYMERGNTLDDSNRTPYSRGGYTQGGYTEGGGTLDDSNHTPYSQGGYTLGGYTLNNSERTPYTERIETLTNPGRSSQQPSFTTETYTGNYDSTDHQGMNLRTRRYTGGRGGSQMSSIYSAQYDGSAQNENLPSCASTSGTTVANGGHGRCPYQIAFQVQNMGKQVSSSKRIINFRFGFANASAMSQGRTGTGCRGEEHDIVVTWSITGGKRSISMNGREIQYSAGRVATESRRADVLDASWRMSDHVYNMKCFAYKPAAGSPEKRNPRWVRDF